ncbi:MAG: hypothetical protein A4E57_00471 [Syntrophorhabdaceae bacterium PtaU1.Bin034]|nr:MAG: hypothetical protein A4E57_00471 [Syntrophorhabdaceae bacterium PtaU1.Bin034]
MTTNKAILRRNKGSALVLAVVFLVVTSLLALAFTYMFQTHTASNLNMVSSMKGFYIAEGGIEKGIKSYKANCSGYTGEEGTSLGGGAFTVEVVTTDFSGTALSSNKRRLRSTGVIGGSTRIVEQIVSCQSANPMAITGRADLVLQNSGLIDCGSGVVCYQQQINNRTCPCGRKLTPLPSLPSLPSPAPSSPHSGCVIQNKTTVTWPAGTYYCPSFVMQNNSTLNLAGPVTLYCDSFSLQNSSTMNAGGSSGDLLVIDYGSAALQNSAVFRGAIYAGGSFATQNSSQIYGTVGVRGTGVIQNSAQIHYESTAGNTSTEYDNIYDVSVHWREYIQ